MSTNSKNEMNTTNPYVSPQPSDNKFPIRRFFDWHEEASFASNIVEDRSTVSNSTEVVNNSTISTNASSHSRLPILTTSNDSLLTSLDNSIYQIPTNSDDSQHQVSNTGNSLSPVNIPKDDPLLQISKTNSNNNITHPVAFEKDSKFIAIVICGSILIFIVIILLLFCKKAKKADNDIEMKARVK